MSTANRRKGALKAWETRRRNERARRHVGKRTQKKKATGAEDFWLAASRVAVDQQRAAMDQSRADRMVGIRQFAVHHALELGYQGSQDVSKLVGAAHEIEQYILRGRPVDVPVAAGEGDLGSASTVVSLAGRAAPKRRSK